MALHHKSLKSEIHRTLRDFRNVLAVAGEMARITKERKFRTEAPEFHDILPERVVAVFDLLRCGESPVYHANLAYSGTVQPLKSANPQVQIGVHRILHEHRDVRVG